MENNIYVTPLSGRYPSEEMNKLWSNDSKYTTWRKLWIALAETEKELGINITDEQIEEMKAHVNDIDYDIVAAREKECRHDVMSHVYEFGIKCPKAKPIIHLGATSCFVTDNTDVILMTEALKLIKQKLVVVINNLKKFAEENKSVVCLGYTHFQPAQLTTVGKRATLWMQDLIEDLEELEFVESHMKLLGSKGTTGTQESFMKLFKDEEKVKQIDGKFAEKMGFEKCYAVSGQTYTRKLDSRVLNVLAQIAQSASKFANDMRLLQHEKELEEPFEKGQIGSSAMAYKRNPMRSERINSLSRHVLALAMDPAITASTQWLERTLDDSANKRICVPEAFLAVDSILILYANISSNIVVYKNVINTNLMQELPFMGTEEIIMNAVLKGGDRQELHEKIRVYSMEAGREVKEFGRPNDLVDRIANDASFGLTKEEILKALDPANLCGRAMHQVDDFITEKVNPVLEKYGHLIEGVKSEVNV
ncbi:MAG: adenylosuccinate lyase [Clostridia bacterium]|nr:adenylosuccinate lyase [Clostridia bacterium]